MDGITKLAAAGIPIEQLIDIVPGVTQQKVQAIKESLRRNQTNNLVAALQQLPAAALAPVSNGANPN